MTVGPADKLKNVLEIAEVAEPTHIINEPGYEKKVMRGPADKLENVLEIAEVDEAISGWKLDAIIFEGNGMAKIIFKRKIQ